MRSAVFILGAGMRVSSNPEFGRLAHLGLASGLALATSCSSVLAQDHETWRCDAPNGSYDRNAATISGSTTSVSGRIIFHRADFGPPWSSSARIGFTDSRLDDGDCRCNGIFVKAFRNPDVVGFFMLVDGEVVELSGRPFDIPITFSFSIDPQGVMTARVGKEHVEMKTATLSHSQHDALIMSCTGANVSFLNVNVE